MHAIIMSDLHAHPWREHSRLVDGVGSRLLDCVSVLKDVREYCLRKSITLVILGGDLFHKPGVLFTGTFNLVVAELVEMQRAEIKVISNVGNHDFADRAGEVHAMQALAHAGLVDVVEGGLSLWGFGDHTIVGFDYCDSRDTFLRRVEQAQKAYGPVDLALFHHGFKGARVGTHLEYQVREELDASEIGLEYRRAFSGHYHSHQPIKGMSRAHYIGSPLEHTRSNRDEATAKGFLVYDFEANTYVLHKLKRPRFVTIEQAELDAGDFAKAEGNFVDCRWTDYTGGAEKLGADLEDAGAEGIKLIYVPDSVDAPLRASALDPLQAPADAFKAFLEGRREHLAAVGVPYDPLEAAGLEVLSQVALEDEG